MCCANLIKQIFLPFLSRVQCCITKKKTAQQQRCDKGDKFTIEIIHSVCVLLRERRQSLCMWVQRNFQREFVTIAICSSQHEHGGKVHFSTIVVTSPSPSESFFCTRKLNLHRSHSLQQSEEKESNFFQIQSKKKRRRAGNSSRKIMMHEFRFRSK